MASVARDENGDQDDERDIGEERDNRHDPAPRPPGPRICRRNGDGEDGNCLRRTAHRKRTRKHSPCSTCGSSSASAFSVSVPPTMRVGGMRQKLANHQSGKRMNPTKNSHACTGEPCSSTDGMCRPHDVGRIRGGFRGSRMWYPPERMLIDGACGATSALMGNEISDMLRRRSARDCARDAGCRCAFVLIDSGRPERVDDAVLDVARCRLSRGMPLRLGQESMSCGWVEPGRECAGLAEGDAPDVERRARFRPWYDEGGLLTSDTWCDPACAGGKHDGHAHAQTKGSEKTHFGHPWG